MRHLPALRLCGDPALRRVVLRLMSTQTPPDFQDLHAYRHWKPEYQQKALEALRQAQNQAWRPFFCPDPTCTGHPHCKPITGKRRKCPAPNGHLWTAVGDLWICGIPGEPGTGCGATGQLVDRWSWEHARADQRPPRWADDWQNFVMSGGRGSGKTRTGSEITHKAATIVPNITLIGATTQALRETMIEGRSRDPGHRQARATPHLGAVPQETDLAQRVRGDGVQCRRTRPAAWPRTRLRVDRRTRPLPAHRGRLVQHGVRAARQGQVRTRPQGAGHLHTQAHQVDEGTGRRTHHRGPPSLDLPQHPEPHRRLPAQRHLQVRRHPAGTPRAARRDHRRRRGRTVVLRDHRHHRRGSAWRCASASA
jgi:hypothetical protein